MREIATVRKLVSEAEMVARSRAGVYLSEDELNFVIRKIREISDESEDIDFYGSIRTLQIVSDCFEDEASVRGDCLRLLSIVRMELADEFFQYAMNGKCDW